MDLYRFYLPTLREQHARSRILPLPEDEAHHATAVLRLDAGAPVALFDGLGTSAQGKLIIRGRRDLAVESSELTLDPEPALRLTIATAVPKGDRAEWLVDQASQLGVWRLQWLTSDRGIVKPRDEGGKMDKWKRLAIESAKQCGRNHLLAIQPQETLQSILSGSWRRILWLDPREGGKPITQAMSGITIGEILALIGPEGGWSKREGERLESLGRELARVRLGRSVLRIETACAAVAALVLLDGS